MYVMARTYRRTQGKLRLHDSSSQPAEVEPGARHSGANGKIHKY